MVIWPLISVPSWTSSVSQGTLLYFLLQLNTLRFWFSLIEDFVGVWLGFEYANGMDFGLLLEKVL